MDNRSIIVARNKLYSDISLKFTIHPAYHDIRPLTDLEAVKAAIINIVLTNKGERPFNPYFGCNVTKLLFLELVYFREFLCKYWDHNRIDKLIDYFVVCALVSNHNT